MESEENKEDRMLYEVEYGYNNNSNGKW